jgi:Mg2+ and Co2+ transporter CorA
MSNMPKYKVEHYEKKIRRHFDPLVEEQELLVKQYRTEATKRIVGKLSKKMGADKIMDAFKKATEQMKKAQQDAKTFFKKKAKQDEKKTLTYNMRDDEISLKDCEEQLQDWAKDLVDRELRRRPEGEQLAQLEAVKQKAMDIVYENGDDASIAKALDTCTKKIGITWVVDTSKIKQISA